MYVSFIVEQAARGAVLADDLSSAARRRRYRAARIGAGTFSPLDGGSEFAFGVTANLELRLFDGAVDEDGSLASSFALDFEDASVDWNLTWWLPDGTEELYIDVFVAGSLDHGAHADGRVHMRASDDLQLSVTAVDASLYVDEDKDHADVEGFLRLADGLDETFYVKATLEGDDRRGADDALAGLSGEHALVVRVDGFKEVDLALSGAVALDGADDVAAEMTVTWMDDERFFLRGTADGDAGDAPRGDAALACRVDGEAYFDVGAAGRAELGGDLLFAGAATFTSDGATMFEVSAEADYASVDDEIDAYASSTIYVDGHSDVLQLGGTFKTTGDMRASSHAGSPVACLVFAPEIAVADVDSSVNGEMTMSMTAYLEELEPADMGGTPKRVTMVMDGSSEEMFDAMGLPDDVSMDMHWRPDFEAPCDQTATATFSAVLTGSETPRPTDLKIAPTPAPARTLYALEQRMTVSGVDASAFDNDDYVDAFKDALAATLTDVEADDIYDLEVVDGARRRLGENGLVVAYAIRVFEAELGGLGIAGFEAQVQEETAGAVDGGAFDAALVEAAEASGDAYVVALAEATAAEDVVTFVPTAPPSPAVPAPTAEGASKKGDASNDVAGLPIYVAAFGAGAAAVLLLVAGLALCSCSCGSSDDDVGKVDRAVSSPQSPIHFAHGFPHPKSPTEVEMSHNPIGKQVATKAPRRGTTHV